MPPLDISNSNQRLALYSLVATTIVVLVKLVAAYWSGSISVLAEGLQSLVDIVIALTTLAVLRLSARPPDESHPYGHGKAELLSGAFQMMIIIAVSVAISIAAWMRFRTPQPIETGIGMYAMGYAVISNLIMASWIGSATKGSRSIALSSEQIHLRTDALASLGVFLGLLLVRVTSIAVLDPIVAVICTGVSLWVALTALLGLVHPLMDGALPQDQIDKIKMLLDRHPEVRGYHELKSRQVGGARYVDLHILLEDCLTFVRAHDIAEQIEREIEVALEGAYVTIHFEPAEVELAHRAREHTNA